MQVASPTEGVWLDHIMIQRFNTFEVQAQKTHSPSPIYSFEWNSETHTNLSRFGQAAL